jgi:hypothetical protein
MPIDSYSLHAYEVLKSRHAELLVEAEKARLAAQAMPTRRPFYHPVLAWTGRRLAALGRTLEERYDPPSCCPEASI